MNIHPSHKINYEYTSFYKVTISLVILFNIPVSSHQINSKHIKIYQKKEKKKSLVQNREWVMKRIFTKSIFQD